ncbi:glucan-binding YG repeat protein [Bacillus sp. SORGH_AS 510]|uniref:NlpC/P60 family protein n=1 Tax=Bacillus sp. SORGH_AS_0510 TaxID=3041771 RepID=UPI00277E916C|nr:NlpC/P60 family protein [Bacillus sp. SORGH_AS_0510]MDQ1144322.1 glucan-binding YG repeat protein [Bacillus sp. SORGH_AS_0510]
MKKLIVGGLLSCSLLLSGFIGGQKAEASSFGDKVTDIALDYIGVPYVWGGTTPSGFDCSGFTSYSYKQAGVSIPRTASEQYTKGQAVSKSNLVEGDLVFFSTYKAGASHVGIYLGDNKFVHASSSAGVKISSLTESYYSRTYIGSKRIGNYNNGWVLSGRNWYFYKDGVMQKYWIKDGGTWYYLESNGVMKTGWLLYKNDWYYFASSGAMLTGWVYSGSHWYYLNADGDMAKNTVIDGYRIGSDGAWIE